MAEYNHLLSQRATSYAFEINRLKTLVVRHATHVVRKRLLKSSRKNRTVDTGSQERINILQKEIAGEIDNNIAENDLRGAVMDRKNSYDLYVRAYPAQPNFFCALKQ